MKSVHNATWTTPLLGVAVVTVILLMVPLVAMQFTAEVLWGPGDFVAAGVLLFASGTAIVIAIRRVKGNSRLASVVAAIALGLALVWAELAVGLLH